MPDDRLLDRDPMLRLHQRPFGGAFVFHAGQGVEGVEPGHVPLVAQAAGYPPREPVVAVDQAIAAAAATLLAQDGFAEVGKQIEEARLIDVVRGSNGKARDPALLGQPDPVPPVRARPAGEDFGRDAATAELFADRPDVDVHPAVLARPKGRDRGRVQTDDGEWFQRRASLQSESTDTSSSPVSHQPVNFESVRDRQQCCVEWLTAVDEGALNYRS